MIQLTRTAIGEATSSYLPFSLPWIGEEEIAAVVDCLRSGWLTTGPRVKQFEAEFAEYLGCRHAVAVNSCTAALHLALEALGIGPGDEVLVPTMTFAATAEVVHYLGARPVLLDSDPQTLCVDVDRLASFLEENCRPGEEGPRNRSTGARVRAVIPVHYAGLPCRMERLVAIARSFGLAVVEDAAHALPAHVRGRPAGTLGTAAAFSFYATKTITTGEGGMLTTDDEALAERARMMSLHGISRDAWLRFTVQGSWYYEILEPGFKYNMTDIAAALGLQQLRRSDDLWEIRRRYAARYTDAFRALPEVETPAEAAAQDGHAWHLYVLRLNRERLRIDRTAFIEELRACGIGTSVHFIPLHLHPYYRNRHGYQPADFPVASAAYERILSLPLYPRMALADVDRVIDAVTEIVATHRA
jgi:dTDP-4-amino-4,6-dideoxygalactose transaminase